MTLYVPPLFRPDEPAMLDLVERHPFGTLLTTGAAGLQVSHVPFLLERDAGGRARLLTHLARANPQAAALAGAAEVLAIFQGPHAYVSPGWYREHPAVPTWNYAVVHAHCNARAMEEAELHEFLIRMSDAYEKPRAEPWRAADLPGPYMSSMLTAIVGYELAIERLEGKFKLSQNRPAEVQRVIAALEREGEGDLAALMRARNPETTA